MLNFWFSRYDTICADNTSTSGSSCRPVSQCEVGVVSFRRQTIQVDCVCVVVLPKGVPPPGLGGVGFGSSPYLATDHIIYVLCLPSERGMGLSMPWQFQSRVEVLRDVRVHGSSCGTYRDVLHSPLDEKHHRCHCSCRDHVLCVSLLTVLFTA